MATDTFQTTSGSQSWDDPANWSLNAVPGSGDDVSITGPTTATSTINIAATDPAYVVSSLTEVNQKKTFPEQEIDVAGKLTVTGNTSINSGELYVTGSGSLSLNTVTLLNSAELYATSGNAATRLSIGSVTGSSGSVGVFNGQATITSVSGSISILVDSGATATIGNSAGTSSFGLDGGTLVLQSSNTTLNDTVELSSPAPSSTIDLQNIRYQAGEIATITASGSGFFTSYTVTLRQGVNTLYTFEKVTNLSQTPTAPLITVSSDGANGTLVTLACFTPGTSIATPSGEVPAGSLRIGDHVLTAGGESKPILWIGRRSYAGRFLARQRHLLPVSIRAGALGNGLPRRDLLVSPCHAMFLDGVLVPAGSLLNGTSIVQEIGADHVDYVHLELADHDLILAEGAASETFIDDYSRNAFHNASEYHALYPDAPTREPVFYAPRLTDGHVVEAIRNRIAALAEGKRRAA